MIFTNQSETFTFSGTARDFVASNVTLNGKILDAVSVNSLAKHELLEATGFGAKPARGRTPRIFKAVSRNGFNFGTYVAPIVDPATAEYFAPVANIEANATNVIALTQESVVEQAAEYQAEAIAEAQAEVTVESDAPF